MRLVPVAVIALVACRDSTSPEVRLDAARARWKGRGFGPYEATVRTLCECGFTNPIRILVVNDSVQAAVDTQTGQAIDQKFVKSIEGLFATIDEAIARPAASANRP